MNLKVISRNVGLALLVSSLFMFLSVLVSMANGNDSALAALSISFIITFTVGIFPLIFVRTTPKITLTDGYLIICLSWLLSFLFGMLPYLLWGGPFTVMNAWFESVSGFTATGGTILERVEDLPNSLLFWRSSTHFIGGLGVVVFVLLVIPMSGPVRLRLVNVEMTNLSKGSYKVRTNKVARIFACVYIAITLAAFLCYWIAGMSPFDAINHAFSIAATGGFSTRTKSIGDFHSPLINWITMVFMLLGSIHYGIIYMVATTRSLKPLNNAVLKFYLCCVLFAGFVASSSLIAGGMPVGKASMMGFFHTLTYTSTAGFSLGDVTSWGAPCSAVLILMGIFCGMAGSTSGGLKVDRLMLFFKSVSMHIKKSIYPTSVSVVKVGGKTLSDDDVYPHVLLIAIYFMLAFASVFLCRMSGTSMGDSLAGTISALGNLGASFGDLGTYGEYNPLNSWTKFILTVDMFLGRLEIYPALATISILFHKRRY